MGKINHFFREEKVYEDCCDRGVCFKEYVNKMVEHYQCSDCGIEVNKNNVFCPKCGTKFSGIKEFYKASSCLICGTKFKQLSHEEKNCCTRCSSLIDRNRYDREELAKVFFELGKKQ